MLARAAGVPYAWAAETSSAARARCEQQLNRKFLDRARAVDFEHDTLLDVVRARLDLRSEVK